MRLTLEGVTKTVRGQSHLYDLDLDLASGSFNVLLGPTQAGKTSLLAADGRARSPEHRHDPRGRRGRDRGRRAQAQRGDGLPGVRELPVVHRLREHRRAAAPRAGACRTREIDAKVESHGGEDADRAPARPAAVGAIRRPAAARRAGPGARQGRAVCCCSTSRWSTWTTSCARSCAPKCGRSSAAAPTTVVYATTEPQEALLFGGNVGVLDAGRLLQHGPGAGGLSPSGDGPGERGLQRSADKPHSASSIGAQGCRLSPDVAFPLADHMRALAAGRLSRRRARQPHRRRESLPRTAACIRATVAAGRDQRLRDLRPRRARRLPMIAQLGGRARVRTRRRRSASTSIRAACSSSTAPAT